MTTAGDGGGELGAQDGGGGETTASSAQLGLDRKMDLGDQTSFLLYVTSFQFFQFSGSRAGVIMFGLLIASLPRDS